jgi:Asp-tRNA(Asn)/Glu-tRNA(Gln) amidotransferase A subunit family amidase
VELLEACIARIEAINPHVNAVTATAFTRARAEARAAEAAVLRGDNLGLLHGLPLGVKDLEETAGLLTTYGSPIYRANVPAADNLLVARLRAAGAIVTAKTNVPEMGAGANSFNPVWGATGNPFDPRLNAGGSSGGSACALALDLLPICTGSDTGGSLRIPAAKCGVVGFRPSPGLVPSARRPLGWSPISVVGPMGRSVADACLQLTASAGVDASDPLSYPVDARAFLNLPPVDLGRLRVGITEDFGCCDVDDDIRTSFRAKVAAMTPLFRSVHTLDFSGDDHAFANAHRCFDVLRAVAFVTGMREAYERDPMSLGPNPRSNYELGARMSLLDVSWAEAEQTRLLKRFQSVFDEVDIVLSPVTPVSPFPWSQPHATQVQGRAQANYYRWLALTYVTTLTTHPALSLPCGTDAQGLPFGLQVLGRFRDDLGTLAAGQAMEAAFASHPALARPRPDPARLGPVTPALRSIVTAPPVLDATVAAGAASAV